MPKQIAWTVVAACGIAACFMGILNPIAEVILPAEALARDRYPVLDESTITRTLRFGGSGERTLDVRTINGSIRVSGSEDAEVELVVRKSIRAESDADVRAAESEVTVGITENAPRIEAIVRDRDGQVCGNPSGRAQWRRRRYEVTFDLTIRVPRNARLRLCAINEGEIRVDQTTGAFEISNVNGRIAMDGIRGSGSASTVNGTVAVSFREAPSAASLFKTVNGDVTVTFPEGLSADLKMKTFNGGLFTDFDVQGLPEAAPVAVKRRGGRSIYRSNDFTRVRAGRGGPEITFETLNGDVRVLRASR
jgi:DUF4097 and DUF4098 domain-containing protein YvlB